jgi:S-adenosylmethionine-diacylgycerolhomoserine-N-methlytransferase
MLADLKVLYAMARGAGHGDTHAARLENFYASQAEHYDRFRQKLLSGRAELYAQASQLLREQSEAPLWVDMGGGTGWNISRIDAQVRARCRAIKVVDLASSLLRVARERIRTKRWHNVEAVEADATQYRPGEGLADVVSFSYSLTMIPDFRAAIEQAHALLRPGGIIAVVDFYTSPSHSVFTRTFWPRWFQRDGVYLGPERLSALRDTFSPIECAEMTSKVPYIPFIRVPYFRFFGRKR